MYKLFSQLSIFWITWWIKIRKKVQVRKAIFISEAKANIDKKFQSWGRRKSEDKPSNYLYLLFIPLFTQFYSTLFYFQKSIISSFWVDDLRFFFLQILREFKNSYHSIFFRTDMVVARTLISSNRNM